MEPCFLPQSSARSCFSSWPNAAPSLPRRVEPCRFGFELALPVGGKARTIEGKKVA
jgi:hypothetical protein